VAAITPASHNYFYFLHKNGQLLLAKTLAEHNSNQK
jgi:cell division protein YceG involved in septum cleavage